MNEIRLSPYINFQGRAREAMEFYQQALGGAIDLQTMNAQGQSAPAGAEDRISHARLEVDGAVILGSDGHPDYPAKVGDNMAVVLSGVDSARLTRAFNALAEGGYVKAPLTEQPGGASSGYLLDKFGVNWMVTVEKA
ncbi:MAG TPA: VOC family protein [Ktedonobacterales bacterium]|jgi:PhnB protein|nr:VOC family protein [Ktedonobacterales bacterium]